MAAVPTAAAGGMDWNPFEAFSRMTDLFTFDVTGRKKSRAFVQSLHGTVVEAFQRELRRISADPTTFAIFPANPPVLSIIELLTGVREDAFRPKSDSDKRGAYVRFVEAIARSAPNTATIDALPRAGGAPPPPPPPTFQHVFVNGPLAVPPPRTGSSSSSVEIPTDPRTALELDTAMRATEDVYPSSWYTRSVDRERLAVWILTYPHALLHNPASIADTKPYLGRLHALLHEADDAPRDIEDIRTAIHKRCVELSQTNEARADVAWVHTLDAQRQAYEDGLLAPLRKRIALNEAQIAAYDAQRKRGDADVERLQHEVDDLTAANATLKSELAAATTVHTLLFLVRHLDATSPIRDRVGRFLDVQRAMVDTFKQATEKTTPAGITVLLDRAERHMRRMRYDLALPVPPPPRSRMFLALVGWVYSVC